MLPDLDLLLSMHSGPTHSIGAAALVGVVRAGSGSRAGVPAAQPIRGCVPGGLRAATYCSTGSGADASPPLGIMALWPFSRAYYESDLHLFMAISRRYYQGWVFVQQNLRAVTLELATLVPILVLVGRFCRRRTGWSRA